MEPRIFCCPDIFLIPTMRVYTNEKRELWRFAFVMAGPPPFPVTGALSSRPTQHNHASSSVPIAPLPPTPSFEHFGPSFTKILIPEVIRESDKVFQFEKWVDGEKVDERFYIAHPDWEAEFLEVPKAHIWKDFVRNWQYIKILCAHSGTMYLLKMLERVEDDGEAVIVDGGQHYVLESGSEEAIEGGGGDSEDDGAT